MIVPKPARAKPSTDSQILFCRFVTIFDYHVDTPTFYAQNRTIIRVETEMEPEVHIVERYMQLVKRCFTMTNVVLEGGKEIDLLAVNSVTNEKFHIEARVAIGKGFRLRLVDTQTRKGQKHKRGLDTLNEIKFVHPTVSSAVKDIFGGAEYKKVLVVWDVEEHGVIQKAKDIYGIEIWKISDILNELLKEVKTKPYRDDVLRTTQLISKIGM